MDPTIANIDRTRQMLAAAEALLIERRSVAISLSDIAERIGVSRSLLYVYFDGVPAIVDALFRKHARRLEHAVMPILASSAPYRERSMRIGERYLDYLIEAGPLLNLVLRERHQDSPLGDDSRALFRRFLRAMAADMRESLDISTREAFVLLELNSAIPEALARLVRSEQIDKHTAHITCERLLGASTDAFPQKG